jgi:glutamate synthase (NADPH/NADH) large chain
MLLPEPWDHNISLTDRRRAWDAYQSMLMEAWDGPAAIAFSDGIVTGAALDRNGLRPARYYVTDDDRLILSSEAGALDIDSADILKAGSLGPGEMLLVDPAKGRVCGTTRSRTHSRTRSPTATGWMPTMLRIESTSCAARRTSPARPTPSERGSRSAWRATATTSTTSRRPSSPWQSTGKAPLASMGADIPLAVLSKRPRSLSTTSTSCSPRSRTRPSTRCARVHHLHAAVRGQPRQHAGGCPHELPPGAPEHAHPDA